MKCKWIGWAAMMVMASSQAADVGVSVSVGQPGFYGRLDIGNFPQPQLIYAKPIIIEPVRAAVVEPVYLRVPPGHAKDWRKHCRKYDACGRPVYFVQDRWYNNVYVPRYRETHGGRDDRRGDGDRDDRRGDGDRDDRRGKGHGKGHDKN